MEETESLSPEQAKALSAVQSGKSIFITGSAGVGKSFLLNKIIKSLPATIGVTASTGVAACNIGGTTLHSFAGIGLGDKPIQQLVSMVRNRREAWQRWMNTKVLVIDEISMIDGGLFDTIEQVARLVRRVERPFGGLQVILCGDFLQLPPVHYQNFAFESSSWRCLVDEVVVLKKVFRQKNVGFVALLNRLRYGQITSLDIEVLHLCSKTLFPEDGIKPTRLYPHRWRVEKDNRFELNKLAGKSHYFVANDWAKYDKFREQLEKNSKFPKELELKVGAQVMLLVNKDVSSGLVNGSRGVVVGFQQKNQPMDIDDKEEENDYVRYPIVRFVNGVEMKVGVEKLTISVNGRVVAWRLQVPLLLAWAVSIHKAQGMTMERVEVDIAAAFEHGQAYVALSRVTGLDGLLLRDFDPGRVTAHPKVVQYYRQLDPTYEDSMKLGLDDLKSFIKRRHDYETYKKSVQEQVPSKCLSDTDYEHDYHKKRADLSNSRTKVLRIHHDNELESPGKSKYVRVNGTCRKQNTPTPTATATVDSPTMSSKVPDVKTMTDGHSTQPSPVPTLARVEKIASKCRSMLQEIHKTNIPTKAEKLELVVIPSDDEDVHDEGKSIRRSRRLRGKKRKSYLDIVNDVGDSPVSTPVRIKESSVDDVITKNPSTLVDATKHNICTDFDTSNSEMAVKENPNFMSMICPDLLEMSKNVTGEMNKEKIRMEEIEAERIRTLLKEKDAQIQEKRRKALERRRLSLQRNGVASTMLT